MKLDYAREIKASLVTEEVTLSTFQSARRLYRAASTVRSPIPIAAPPRKHPVASR
jgi:hypothetical protein